jgi:hypothetical protein
MSDIVTPADVVASARTLLKTSYHQQGRLPGVGIDCAGVPIVVARHLGLVAPDFDVTGYSARPDGTLLAVCDRFMIRTAVPEVGGVVVVAVRREDQPSHLGIVASWLPDPACLSLIHADNVRARRVIETRLEFSAALRLVQAYRLPGVEYG